jgi:hypothetical protein
MTATPTRIDATGIGIEDGRATAGAMTNAAGRIGALGLWSATAMLWCQCGAMEASRCGRALMPHSRSLSAFVRCHRHRPQVPVLVQHSRRGKCAYAEEKTAEKCFSQPLAWVLAVTN